MSGGNAAYTIREVAQQTGLEESRIRFFERAFAEFFEDGEADITRRAFSQRHVAILRDITELLPLHRNNLSAVRGDLARRHPLPTQNIKLVTVTSGKGGVGKTTLAVNLAVALAARGARTLLFDADLGLANVHVLAGVNPKATLIELLNGEASIDEIISDGPGGVRAICGGSGISGLADLKPEFVTYLGRELRRMGRLFDVVVIDTAAGITSNVMHFVRIADVIAVVATPNLASTLDAYSMLKVSRQEQVTGRLSLLVNQVADEPQAQHVFDKISSCAQRFLSFAPERIGHLLRDPLVEMSAQRREPFVLAHPQSENSRLLGLVAERVLAAAPAADAAAGRPGTVLAGVTT